MCNVCSTYVSVDCPSPRRGLYKWYNYSESTHLCSGRPVSTTTYNHAFTINLSHAYWRGPDNLLMKPSKPNSSAY